MMSLTSRMSLTASPKDDRLRYQCQKDARSPLLDTSEMPDGSPAPNPINRHNRFPEDVTERAQASTRPAP